MRPKHKQELTITEKEGGEEYNNFDKEMDNALPHTHAHTQTYTPNFSKTISLIQIQ